MKIVTWKKGHRKGLKAKTARHFKHKPRKNWTEWRAIPSSDAIRVAGRSEAKQMSRIVVGATESGAKKVSFVSPNATNYKLRH